MTVQINTSYLFSRLATDLDLDIRTTDYIVKRLNAEGISILTSVLPHLDKVLVLAVTIGSFPFAADLLDFTSIRRCGGLLRYFRGYLLKIFNSNGSLRKDYDVIAFYAMRQLCSYFYKLAIPFTDEQISYSADKFIEVDDEVAKAPIDFRFIGELRDDISDHFCELNRVSYYDLLSACPPRPGNGTFSTKVALPFGSTTFRDSEASVVLSTNKAEKFFVRRSTYHGVDPSASGFFKPYPAMPKGLANRYRFDDSVAGRLEYSNGSTSLLGPRYRYIRKSHSVQRIWRSECFPLSEVLFVPKDSRGPRTIVREPYDGLLVQMAYFDWMTSYLQKVTDGHIQFADQTLNQKLAWEGSLTGYWCTLDLKEASDRVSYNMTMILFKDCPGITKLLEMYRTKTCILPDGRLHQLAKLAGMGSGLTFPTMSLWIYLSIVRAIVNSSSLPYSDAKKLVYVYGDDIIVPTKYRAIAEAALSRVCLKINKTKSFSFGPFRESCGVDCLDGNDVSPVRLKLSSADLSVTSDSIVVSGDFDRLSLERHARELVKAGLHQVANYIYKLLESRIGQRLPYIGTGSPALGRLTLLPSLCNPYVDTGIRSTRLSSLIECAPPHIQKKFDHRYMVDSARCCIPISDEHEAYEDDYIHLSKHIRPKQVSWHTHLESNCLRIGTKNIHSVPRSVRYVWTSRPKTSLCGELWLTPRN